MQKTSWTYSLERKYAKLHLKHQNERFEPCGDCVFTVKEMPSLSGLEAYIEGNISTKMRIKICV